MSHKYSTVHFIAIAFLAVIQSAIAQSQAPDGRAGRVGLATRPHVASDLNIDNDKKKMDSLKDLADLQSQEIRETANALRAKGMLDQFDDAIGKIKNKHDSQRKGILTQGEYVRLCPIEWQMKGAAALLDPDLARSLNMTENQQDKITQANLLFIEKQREIFSAPKKLPLNDIKAEIAMLAEKRDEEIQRALTQEQLNKWKEALRPEFGR